MFHRLALVSIIFASIRAGCSKQNFSHCEYKGDMCKVNLENCIRKMRDEGDYIFDCDYGLFYGTGLLYDNRQKIVNFYIKITDNRKLYPDTLTYTIVRKSGKRTIWSEPNSVSAIDGCCNMTENDTCALPKNSPDVHLYALFPLKEKWYCQYYISESIPVMEELKWCKHEGDIACAFYESGNILVRTVSEPLNLKMMDPLDCCFFSVDENYLSPNGKKSFPAPNITYNVSGNGSVAQLPDGETLPCVLRKGIKGNVEDIAKDYHEKSSDFVCFFVIRSFNPRIPVPYCSNVAANAVKKNEENSGTRTSIVISVVVVCVVVLAVIILLVRYFKNDKQKFTFKMPFIQTVWNNVEKAEANDAEPKLEIVDEITFSAIDQVDTGPEVGAREAEETDALTLNTEEEVAAPLCHEDQSAGQSRPPVEQVDTGPEVGAREAEETDALTLNTEEEVAAPLCHEDQSAGQSRPPGFTEHDGMTTDEYTDKDHLNLTNCNDSSPPCVRKDDGDDDDKDDALLTALDAGGMTNDGYTDKDSLNRADSNDISPSYVKKDDHLLTALDAEPRQHPF